MPYNLTYLRANIFKIVDEALETGTAVEIIRRNQRLKLVPERKAGRLARLKPQPGYVTGDPDGLIHTDWSKEWKP